LGGSTTPDGATLGRGHQDRARKSYILLSKVNIHKNLIIISNLIHSFYLLQSDLILEKLINLSCILYYMSFGYMGLLQRFKLEKFEIIPAPIQIFDSHRINNIECRFQLPHNIFLFWISFNNYISLIPINFHLAMKIKYNIIKPL